MKNKVCVFLADGFEEVEGLTVVDLLRRAAIETTTVSVTGEHTIHGAHGIDVQADMLFDSMSYATTTMIVLPGGMPGTMNLEKHEGLKQLLYTFDKEEKYIAAICAAPSILGKRNMLKGRTAVSHPSREAELYGARVVHASVVSDGHLITSRGMGTAIEFSLELITTLVGEKQAEEIRKAIVYGKE